jgi:hypothetical protein
MLTLPQRPPAAADADLPDFPPPEAAAPLARTVLAPATPSRVASRDQLAGTAQFEVREDTGLYRIDSTGLEYRLTSLDRFRIAADDPLSARAEVTFEMLNGRGDWRTRAVTHTVLTATRRHFRVQATLDAWEGEQRVASREWDVTVPRDRV